MKFVVYAESYKEGNGGIIALHKLCHILNKLGHSAKIWPMAVDWAVPCSDPNAGFIDAIKSLHACRSGKRRDFRLCPEFNTPLACYQDIFGSFVVYPEVVAGNPLGARRVVRWFLNKPGVFTKRIEYGSNDLCFCYSDWANLETFNPGYRKLTVVHHFEEIYKKTNHEERRGGCFMIRKGAGRTVEKLLHDESFEQVDGLSHAEMAKMFNRKKYFVSYDLRTMYSRYAALCGCISVVVPEPGISEEQWNKDPADRFGIAYGMGKIEWALATQPDLQRWLADSNRMSEQSVRDFVQVIVALQG